MRSIHVKGVEIIDDERVPEGEIWLNCPMPTGGKVRYMFSLTDHRMTQPGDASFFQTLQKWLSDITTDDEIVSARLALILQAMDDFSRGRDIRTIAEGSDDGSEGEGIDTDDV